MVDQNLVFKEMLQPYFLLLSAYSYTVASFYFAEELQINSVYYGTFLSYPEEICYPMPPENVKGTPK